MLHPEQSSWQRDLFAVFAAAYSTLALELLMSRLSAYYLSNDSDFIAIPLTMLGLGFGSMHVQLSRRLRDSYRPEREWIYIALSTAASILAVFWIFSSLFPLQRDIAGSDPVLLARKTLAFCLATSPPLYFCGRLLSMLFRARRTRIGASYAADFVGAAVGCLSVPLLLHAFGLPTVVVVLLSVQTLALVVAQRKQSARIGAVALAVMVIALVVVAIDVFEKKADVSGLVARDSDKRAEQLAYRWNAYSRVSLINEIWASGTQRYRIIHDNAQSNVYIGEYRADRTALPGERSYITYLPFLLRDDYRSALVMFAGVGLQMMELDRFGRGAIAIDGVELNPTVVDMGENLPALERFGVEAFLDLPNVTMHLAEGRQFLARTTRTYDVIYAASDAATKQAKTGHSRKYLDTAEAMSAYLGHLSDGGLLIFQSKPYWPKIEPLREAYEAAGLPAFADAIMIMSEQPYSEGNHQHHIVLKKGGFLRSEVERIVGHYPGLRVFYAPFSDEGVPETRELVLRGDGSGEPKYYSLHPTDDRPYHLRVDFAGYTLAPSAACRDNDPCFGSWMKVTTLIVIVLIPSAALALLYLRRPRRMPPLAVFAYLGTTGCAYMLVQLMLIGKLELLFASPLYSMAVLITSFLVANAVGSALVDRLPSLTPLRTVPLAIAACVAGLLLCNVLLGLGPDAPWWLRAALTVVAVGPVGVSLGLFFPMAVRWLRRVRRGKTVPMSYCVSVFASVIGASYAMTMMMNISYTSLLYQALVLYGLAAIPAYFYPR